jgi:hypothetical protein
MATKTLPRQVLERQWRENMGEQCFGMIGITWSDVERECRLLLFDGFFEWILRHMEEFEQCVKRGYF